MGPIASGNHLFRSGFPKIVQSGPSLTGSPCSLLISLVRWQVPEWSSSEVQRAGFGATRRWANDRGRSRPEPVLSGTAAYLDRKPGPFVWTRNILFSRSVTTFPPCVSRRDGLAFQTVNGFEWRGRGSKGATTSTASAGGTSLVKGARWLR